MECLALLAEGVRISSIRRAKGIKEDTILSLLQCPTLITLVTFPVLVVMYMRLARREEQEAMSQFGDAYLLYAKSTPGLIPHLIDRRARAGFRRLKAALCHCFEEMKTHMVFRTKGLVWMVVTILLLAVHVRAQDASPPSIVTADRMLILELTGEHEALRSLLFVWDGDLWFATTPLIQRIEGIEVVYDEDPAWNRYDPATSELETGLETAPFVGKQALTAQSPDSRYRIYPETLETGYYKLLLHDSETNETYDLNRTLLVETGQPDDRLLEAFWWEDRMIFQIIDGSNAGPIAYSALVVDLNNLASDRAVLGPVNDPFWGPHVSAGSQEVVAVSPSGESVLLHGASARPEYVLYNSLHDEFDTLASPFPMAVSALFYDETTLRLPLREGLVDYDLRERTTEMILPFSIEALHRFRLGATLSPDGRYSFVVDEEAPELDGGAGIFLYELPPPGGEG